MSEILDRVQPQGLIPRWSEKVRSGSIVSAVGQFETCGKGLWLVGRGGPVVAAATAQSLLIDGSIQSLLYVMTEDYLRSERPEGEREYSARLDDDLWILSGYGTEHRTESGWVDSTLDGVISRRFDRGLPTIVTSMQRPKEFFHGNLASEIFYQAAIMDVTREEG